MSKVFCGGFEKKDKLDIRQLRKYRKVDDLKDGEVVFLLSSILRFG